MELRPYQLQSINRLRDSLKAGNRRPVLQIPTGGGKTNCATAIIGSLRANSRRVVFTVPALSLVDQTVERFAKQGIDCGVLQARHHLTNLAKPVQVASIQTLARREMPQCDYVISDECHLRFDSFNSWLAENKHIPAIGLSATPWSRGLGDTWDDLIIGATTEQLINEGYLSDFRVFAPNEKPDLSKVKTKLGDYELDGLSKAMNREVLVADVVSTWLAKGPGFGTMCFAVDRLHAKALQQRFLLAGVCAEYMDAFTDRLEREAILKRFRTGDVQVVCNVGVLTTGVDEDVRCIILARPTKSEILYVQIVGRMLRKAEGKDYALLLDHSDTTQRLGFVTDIHHDTLNCKAHAPPEYSAKEKLPKECPKCHFLRPAKVRQCPNCGFVATPVTNITERHGHLTELQRKRQRETTEIDREAFYRELNGYADRQGYKRGWAYHTFKERYGTYPPSWYAETPAPLTPETANWIKAKNIRRARGREKYERATASGRNSPQSLA